MNNNYNRQSIFLSKKERPLSTVNRVKEVKEGILVSKKNQTFPIDRLLGL